ncbi:MAG: hypothetical protein K8L91_29725 [Anaerolineae bacterium]|nr:hypothetical protein [Anaerolineae bacterium]
MNKFINYKASSILILLGILLLAASLPVFSEGNLQAAIILIESDSASVLQEGFWISQSSPQASSGSYLYNSGNPDEVLTLHFSGSYIEIVHLEGPSLGTFAIEVDHTVLRTVITTASQTAFDRRAIINYLAEGTHTLRVYSVEGVIAIDAFYTTIEQAVTQPLSEEHLTTIASNVEGGTQNVTRNNPGNAYNCIPNQLRHIHRVSLTSTTPNNLSGSQVITGDSYDPSISLDGRFVAFTSSASTLTTDSNTVGDIFLRDRLSCETRLISKNEQGIQTNSPSQSSAISDNNQFVVFDTDGSLAQSDNNNRRDVYIYDRIANTISPVSLKYVNGEVVGCPSLNPDISADGQWIVFQGQWWPTNVGGCHFNRIYVKSALNLNDDAIELSRNTTGFSANDDSASPSISANGCRIAFASRANNLVPYQTWGPNQQPITQENSADSDWDIFVSFCSSDPNYNSSVPIRRISIDSNGNQANGGSGSPHISPDGRYVVFESVASNLVPNDGYPSQPTNYQDIFIYDLQTNSISRVSYGLLGAGNNHSYLPTISNDHYFIVYQSLADNLDTSLWTVNQQSIYVNSARLLSYNNAVPQRANQSSQNADISADGRFLAFDSASSNLVSTGPFPDSNSRNDVFVLPIIGTRDTLALFNNYGQVSLQLGLQDSPDYQFWHLSAPTSGVWVMGDWDNNGEKTPGIYGSNGMFSYTNNPEQGSNATWTNVWIGLVPNDTQPRPPVVGRFDINYANDCIGVVDNSVYDSNNDIYALYYKCNLSTPSNVSWQYLSIPLPNPTFLNEGVRQFVAGDWDGDQVDEIAVRRGQFVAFTFVAPSEGLVIWDLAQNIGLPCNPCSDYGTLVAGDWDGLAPVNYGPDSFGLYYQNGYFYYRNDLAWQAQQLTLQIVSPLTPFNAVASWRLR